MPRDGWRFSTSDTRQSGQGRNVARGIGVSQALRIQASMVGRIAVAHLMKKKIIILLRLRLFLTFDRIAAAGHTRARLK